MDENVQKAPRCADCKIEKRICQHEDGTGPVYCPTINFSDAVKASLSDYETPGIKAFAVNATIQEGECYVNKHKDNPHARFAIKPRVQETIEFAHKMGYKKLGLAFCLGLQHEARIFSKIIKEQGFELASVVCSVERRPRSLNQRRTKGQPRGLRIHVQPDCSSSGAECRTNGIQHYLRSLCRA